MADASRPLRFGVLGTGRITRKVGPAIARTPGAELAAVASRDAARAAAWKDEFGAKRAYGSYAELLDDSELDAVYIALPPSLHREWTVKAAERGLHVLCEKPLAPTVDEAATMVAACRQHAVQLMDGVMWVHTPRAATIRAILDAGALGELRRVTSAFTFRADGWAGDEFRRHAELGGGSLLDLGWYCVGVSLWVFGGTPQTVWGRGLWRRDSGDASFTGQLHFSPGETASFDCGFETAMRKWVEIAGDAGSLVCDDFTRPWSPEMPRFWLHDEVGQSSEHRSEPFVQEDCLVAAFCEAVRSGPIHRWADRALDVQRVCDALLRSAREERVVETAG
ncbi:MAG: Gfo/Idh/MocA family oxidoreductase [Planctomycetaceae bacterium]